ncbi:hypothetical protein IMZ29_00665 [Achromobacter sp. GG226]|uniref:hypothetical protein n=1 Tax=Verticiella alkaliphila TaxID=2779529 RepID=UPI001C0ADF98|nr:hypothetical protein [Verticiella sp. GG226]MBU4609114.1 hypothetical protein [Verticiella sp. GG226]
MLTSSGGLAGSAMASPADAEPPMVCVQDTNVDSCWRAGVQAQQQGDIAQALQLHERSCDARLQEAGCYEAGKILLLNARLRDVPAAEARFKRVCDSDDIGLGPYACKYLGVIYRDGFIDDREPALMFERLASACFLHNAHPFIDGDGCGVLARNVPKAQAMGLPPDGDWDQDYTGYLAEAMGCTDDMPDLCVRALSRLDRATSQGAAWVARCDDDVRDEVAADQDCRSLAMRPQDPSFEDRQARRLHLVSLFRTAALAWDAR